jgi:hypothetical protein
MWPGFLWGFTRFRDHYDLCDFSLNWEISVLITVLHTVVRWTMPFLGIPFNVLLVIRSYPGLYFVLNFLWCNEFDWLCYLYRFFPRFVDFCLEVFVLWQLIWFECQTRQNCSLFLYDFVPSPGELFWLVWCVVSVILVVWLLSRMYGRCQPSLLNFEIVPEMFFLLSFLFGIFNF